MANRMLAAETPEELEILMCPGKLNTQQAFDYLQMLRNGQQAPPTPKWIGILDSLSVPLELVSIRYSDTLTRSALFTPDSQGEWKLDFDAYAQLCIPEFSSLLDEGDQEGLVRVHIMQDHYFNNCFGDESEWDCYLLIQSSEETSLFGYCKRGSTAHSAMQALRQRVLHHAQILPEEPKSNRLSASQLATRATLHIKRPPEAEARQFEITRVISDDWVISDKPFDERLAEKKTK